MYFYPVFSKVLICGNLTWTLYLMIYFMYYRVGSKSFRKKGWTTQPYAPDLGQADFRNQGEDRCSMPGDNWETLKKMV